MRDNSHRMPSNDSSDIEYECSGILSHVDQ